jgi:DNA-binding winged helix-turn-helix (wHTH) protein
VELYLTEAFPCPPNQNVYRCIEEIINNYFLRKKKVLFAFQISGQIDLTKVPDFRDFIVFLDHIRDNTKGNLNFIISTSIPLFNELNPAPIPLIIKYFNYYDKGRIYRSVNEDILADMPFKRHTSEDVLKLIELSGGLIAVIKNLTRDLLILNKKISSIHELEINKEFFTEYSNCKMRLDRMMGQLSSEYKDALYQIAIQDEVGKISKDIMDYMKKTSIIDEDGSIRGVLLPEYLRLFYKPSNTSSVVKREDGDGSKDDSKGSAFAMKPNGNITLYKGLSINKASGEIFINNIPQDYYLTEKELGIFNLLYSKANQSVDREEIARLLWGINRAANYSDWAIDKIVSRLREKLYDKKPYKVIKTSRGKGFEMIISN